MTNTFSAIGYCPICTTDAFKPGLSSDHHTRTPGSSSSLCPADNSANSVVVSYTYHPSWRWPRVVEWDGIKDDNSVDSIPPPLEANIPDTVVLDISIPQPDTSTLPSAQHEIQLKQVCWYPSSLFCLLDFISRSILIIGFYLQAQDSPNRLFSFNIDDLLVGEEVSLANVLVMPISKPIPADTMKGHLQSLLNLLTQSIQDLVQDAQPIQDILQIIRSQLSPVLNGYHPGCIYWRPSALCGPSKTTPRRSDDPAKPYQPVGLRKRFQIWRNKLIPWYTPQST